MRKLHIFLILLFVVTPLVLMGTYVLYEPSRPTLEGIFVPLIDGITPTIMSLRESFMALPYWQWIGVGIVAVTSIIFARNMQKVWDVLQWGKRGDPRNWARDRGPTPSVPTRIPIDEKKPTEQPTEIAET